MKRRKYSKRRNAHKKYSRSRRRRRNPILGVHSPIYTKRSKVGKYNGPQSVLSVHSASDAGKLLRKRLSDWTRAQHKHAAEDAFKKANQVEVAYGRALDAAAQETWGRAYRASDYRISGIGSDEFSAKRKTQLRNLSHTTGKLKNIGYAHQWASKHARK